MKKFLSVLLSLCMVCSLLPVTAGAAETEAQWGFGEAGIDAPIYSFSGTLVAAFEAANANTNPVCYVKLNTAVEANNAFTLNSGKSMVLDLNEKTIAVTSSTDDINGINNNSGDLTVQNGTITVTNSKTSGYCSAYGIINSGGMLTLNDCTIRASAVGSGGYAGGVNATVGSQTTITNCTVSASSTQSMAFGIETQGTVKIDSGSFTASSDSNTAGTCAISSNSAVTNMLSNSATHGYYIGDELQDNLGTATTVGASGQTVEVKEIVHVCSWTYSASGATMSAICSTDDGTTCNFEGNTTLTIEAPTLTKYGGSGSANATIQDDMDSVGGVNSLEIGYQKAIENDDWEDLDEAPTVPGNYRAFILIESQLALVEYTIAKGTLVVDGTLTASAVYGTKVKDITSFSGATVKLDSTSGAEASGTWEFSGDATTVPNVGDTQSYTATFTPSTGAGDYNPLTQDIVPTITKATYTGETSVNGSAKYGAAGTVDLTGLIVDGGTATYQSHTNSNNALAGTPSVSGTTLNFQFVDDAALAEKTEEIVVGVTSGNYEDYTITVTVTVTDKLVPVVTAPTAITGLIYNGSDQTLITAGSTNGGELQYSLTSGSDYSTELPKATNAGDYTVYYKVVGDADYADVAEDSFSVKIEKKDVTVAPKNVTITKGNAIPAFELTYTGLVGGDTLTPSTAPTFTCFEAGGTTPVSTGTAAGTYTITWTNMDSTTFTTTNYAVSKTATGTLTINNPAPSGGGGGSDTPPTYKVESEVTEKTDGGVSLSTGSARKGDTVTITVTPDTYYQVEEVIVKDSNGKIIEVTENKDGTFSFEMPASKVTVEPVFSWDNPFTDVNEEAYYTPAVEWALKSSITNGTGTTTFSPTASCTRGQMAAFLWRAAGSPEPVGSSNPFADIFEDAYYAKAVQWAYEQGITGGTSANTFSPDAACTRAQMVTFLHRAADTQKPEGSINPFTDVPDGYYTEAVQWAYEQSITGGTSATTFSPDAICARGQMVTFLYRFFGE